MGFTDKIEGPFEKREIVKPKPEMFGKKEEQDPQAPPGWSKDTESSDVLDVATAESSDIHDKAKNALADEGGSQVLGDTTTENETAICSETVIFVDHLDLPEIGEEDTSIKRSSDEQISPAPDKKES